MKKTQFIGPKIFMCHWNSLYCDACRPVRWTVCYV